MEKWILIGGPSQLQLYQQLSHHDFRQLVTHECCNIICIRRELGGTGTECLFQFTYCDYDFLPLVLFHRLLYYFSTIQTSQKIFIAWHSRITTNLICQEHGRQGTWLIYVKESCKLASAVIVDIIPRWCKRQKCPAHLIFVLISSTSIRGLDGHA